MNGSERSEGGNVYIGGISYYCGNMRAVVKVDEKGRISIPKPIREKVGLRPGDLVAVYLESGKIGIEPLESTADKFYGAYRVERWPEDLDKFLAEALRRWWSEGST